MSDRDERAELNRSDLAAMLSSAVEKYSDTKRESIDHATLRVLEYAELICKDHHYAVVARLTTPTLVDNLIGFALLGVALTRVTIHEQQQQESDHVR